MTKEDIKFIARVIYSEAGPGCSLEDRSLVSRTIENRTKHPGFNVKNVMEAVEFPRAYSCVNDPKNTNWRESVAFPAGTLPYPQGIKYDNKIVAFAWNEAWLFATIRISFEECGPQIFFDTGKFPVYYHDRSISKPSSWDNKWYHAVKLGETDHFIYYAAVPANQEASR